MFTVAPKGRTKLVMRSETPAPLLARSMVTARVPLLEAVEKPVSSAGLMARM